MQDDAGKMAEHLSAAIPSRGAGGGMGFVLQGNQEPSGCRARGAGETPDSPSLDARAIQLETTMPDSSEIRIPQDDDRIDVTDLKEVDYWTKWFGVSEVRLRTAVASAGTLKDDLRVYLGLP